MAGIDLLSLFELLAAPGAYDIGSDCIAATPIPGYETHRIGRARDGSPTLLLGARDGDYQSFAAPIVLEHLRVQFDTDCTIQSADGALTTGRFTVVQCMDGGPSLAPYFLRITEAIVAAVGVNPSRQQVGRAIESVIELFRALSLPPKKSVQGLWAELLLIARARHAAVLAAAWHARPEERFDFSLGTERLEVKSVATRLRQHYFSLEQLRAEPGTSILVASLFVERTGAGTSLRELLNVIRRHLGSRPDLLLRLETIVGVTLGNALPRALDETFDLEFAERSLSFYRAADIPSIRSELPSGVSEVHLKSDLTGVVPYQPARDLGEGLFRAVLPAR
jgi:hypothetical protein